VLALVKLSVMMLRCFERAKARAVNTTTITLGCGPNKHTETQLKRWTTSGLSWCKYTLRVLLCSYNIDLL